MTIELIIAVIGSSVLTALVTELFRRGKTRSESRKSNAEAENVMVDTASDLVTQIKAVYEQRVSCLESDVARLNAELDAERKRNRAEIVALMQDLGMMREAAEMQSRKLAELLAERSEQAAQINDLKAEVALWKGRVVELLCAMRDGKPMPEWVKECTHDHRL